MFINCYIMNCYITYLCNDNYLPGIVALIKSLKYHKTKNPIMVMVTKNVSSESTKIISKLEVILKKVNKIHYQGKKKHLILDRSGRKNNSWMTFTKMNIWKQTQYDKILYIDADTVVLHNIDSLFTDTTNHGNICAVKGGSTHHNYKGIESGVLLIKPSINTYNNLIKAMNSDKYDLSMSDQTLINDYFNKHDKIHYLSSKYNRLQKIQKKTIEGAYIYHWNGIKPWNKATVQNFNIWNFYYQL